MQGYRPAPPPPAGTQPVRHEDVAQVRRRTYLSPCTPRSTPYVRPGLCLEMCVCVRACVLIPLCLSRALAAPCGEHPWLREPGRSQIQGRRTRDNSLHSWSQRAASVCCCPCIRGAGVRSSGGTVAFCQLPALPPPLSGCICLSLSLCLSLAVSVSVSLSLRDSVIVAALTFLLGTD